MGLMGMLYSRVRKFRESVEYIMHSSRLRCFGSHQDPMVMETFEAIQLRAEHQQKFSSIPMIIETIFLVVALIFLFRICKIFVFKIR